jgi:hypothetical protein
MGGFVKFVGRWQVGESPMVAVRSVVNTATVDCAGNTNEPRFPTLVCIHTYL